MELLDIYDDYGNATGKTVVRGDKNIVLNDNEHIAVVIIYIENSKGEFLIQKTSLEKGGKYSSTGGHITSGENPLETIKREVKEELGINIDNENIQELGTYMYDNVLRFIFYLKKDIDISDIKIQKEEVSSVSYMSINDIYNLIDNDLITKSHGVIFDKIINKTLL